MDTVKDQTLITPQHEGDTGVPNPIVGELHSSTVNDWDIANKETLQNMDIETHTNAENKQQVKVDQMEIKSQENVNDNMHVENSNNHNNVSKQLKVEQEYGDKETSTQPMKKKEQGYRASNFTSQVFSKVAKERKWWKKYWLPCPSWLQGMFYAQAAKMNAGVG